MENEPRSGCRPEQADDGPSACSSEGCEGGTRDLNRRIVERLRFLQQMRAHNAMLKLSIGDRVTFVGNEGQEVRGRVVRYNRKTVTVLAESGEQWRVSPGMLCKIGPEKEVVSNVVTLSCDRRSSCVRSSSTLLSPYF